MGEMGMAMMGSANAAGVDRARIAAEQAVASPLLEGVNLRRQGVLVNITSSRGLKMKEVHEVMNTVREFAAEDAHIIFGAVYDESMGEEIRVVTSSPPASARRNRVASRSKSSTPRSCRPRVPMAVSRTRARHRLQPARRPGGRPQGAARPSKPWPTAASIASRRSCASRPFSFKRKLNRRFAESAS